MNKLLSLLVVPALCCAGLHAQTNTGAFVIPLGTNVVVQPAITESSVTVDRIIVDNSMQKAFVFLHGVSAPVVLQGADFATLKAVLAPAFKTAFVTYLQAHPRTP